VHSSERVAFAYTVPDLNAAHDQGGNCTDEAVSGMANFPKATEVVVRGCSLSDESFIRIAAACPKTTYVSRAVLPCLLSVLTV
jgi:hypothetical protein